MIADTVGSLLLYLVLTFGLAWPVAARLAWPGPEKLLASAALSLLGIFVFAWAVYVFALPRAAMWALPVVSVLGLGLGWRALRELWRESDVRELAVAQLIVTLWCVGWLALVVSYSGGSWVADWFGHWQRAIFFLERGPRDILFNGFDPLTSRPPLANILTGALMVVTKTDFAHYQLASTVLGSMAFLPAALLARRFGGHRPMASADGHVVEPASGRGYSSITLLAVLFMVSPMFVQNATFAWTKLPAAFFTLAAVHYFLRAGEKGSRRAGLWCAATLAAALLAHYSAGPYAVVIAIAWIVRGWARRREAAWWRETAAAGAVGATVLATWFAWALAVYGPRGTFLTNTSVTETAPSAGAQLLVSALNIRDTLVPHFLRGADYGFIAQASPWGWWRDWFFQLYQLNLFFAFGGVAWLALLFALGRRGCTASPGTRAGWIGAIVATTLLGIGAHAARDKWGLSHICLQPLVLAGLAVLAAHWDSLGRGWRRLLIAGATVDCALGIALHFGAQSFLIDRWFSPDRTSAETLASYSTHALSNLRAKSHFRWNFFGDGFAAHDAPIPLLLGALLLVALVRATKRTARP